MSSVSFCFLECGYHNILNSCVSCVTFPLDMSGLYCPDFCPTPSLNLKASKTDSKLRYGSTKWEREKSLFILKSI